MNDSVFLDTNIIIYAHTDSELIKQNLVRGIITNQNITISTQVLQETANVLNKKSKLSWNEINVTLRNIRYNSVLQINTDQTVLKACEVAEQYRFSFYDSLIIAAALESGAEILFSEDMQHNQLIENKLRIVNPFK